MISDAYYRVVRPHAVCTAPIASLLKSLSSLCSIVEDHAIAHVGSHRPFIAEAQVRYYVSTCGICGQQKWHRDRFFFSAYISVYLQCHSTSVPPPHRVAIFGILTICDHQFQCHYFELS